MLLITMHEWHGPSQQQIARAEPRPKVETRLRGFVTRLPLGAALLRIRDYEEAFRQRFQGISALNYDLISVSQIDDLTDEQIDASRAAYVEKLAQLAEDV